MVHGLVIPAQLPGFHLQRDDGAGKQIVTCPGFAGILRHRITRHEVHQPQLRIHACLLPHASAPNLPYIVIFRPGVMPGFTRSWNRREVPQLFAGFGIDRDHLAAQVVVAIGHPDVNHTVVIRRRGRDGLTWLGRIVA